MCECLLAGERTEYIYRETDPEGVGALSLEAPVGGASGSALHTDLPDLVRLAEDGQSTHLHHHHPSWRERGTEGGREGGREEGREERREGGRVVGRKGERKKEREREREREKKGGIEVKKGHRERQTENERGERWKVTT